MRWILLIALAATMAFAPARAFTPETGLWWNPNESGSGVQTEVQDNILYVTVYAFGADGFPMWYIASGPLDATATVFDGDLYEFFGGACVGCPFQPIESQEIAGSIRLEFDELDPNSAVMTWSLDGGSQRTVFVERFQVALDTPDYSAPIEVEKMLGEWNLTLDFLDFFDDPTLQYLGDVLVFDQVSENDQRFFFGCRPDNSIDALCSEFALENHEAVGFYDAETNSHQLVVIDYFDTTANSDVCAVYDVIVGTDKFDGGQDGDLLPNDGGVAVYYCPQPAGSTVPYDGNYEFFPLEGHRTASRTFVEDGVGPTRATAKASGAKAPATFGFPLTANGNAKRAPVADGARRAELLRAAEQRLFERRQ